jgi:DNA-binding PadR family transcriptional regulator
MRRGDIRRAILLALGDGPANGYEVMRRLEARSGGIWRPSPGSVYPTLQMLEDEGLVRSEAGEGSRTYELTDAGTQQAAAGADASGKAPWDDVTGADDQQRTLREALVQTALATKQLSHAGRQEQVERGIEILQRARKDLYKLLSED